MWFASLSRLRDALIALMFASSIASAETNQRYDLALILAIDCSGSVDATEYRLQLDGIAAAFRDSDIIKAATGGPNTQIMINVMLWADPDQERLTTGWQRVGSAADSEAFAVLVQAMERGNEDGRTGIGVAIREGISLFQKLPFQANRKVIDVSGDGHESWELSELHFYLPQARALLATTDIIVNGLAITQDIPDLDQYYRDAVVGGPGAFVIKARNYASFAEAMRIKLLRELQPHVASINRIQFASKRFAGLSRSSR
jgi:Protein of unknown function (DUF1194)